jgi:phosphatidylserine/phosphatidylglycerophosphate/cardiolipin synthase-like enzyme
MDRTEIERFLANSLRDRKLSGSEREALNEWLEQYAKSDQARGEVRHEAFDLARKSVADPDAMRVIEWLEAALKAIAPVQSRSSAPDMSPDSVYFAPGDACLSRIVHRFQSVQRSADVCVFTITDDRISRAILDAHRRGVKLRIISDAEKADDRGSDMAEFAAAGIAVKLMRVQSADQHSDGHMHHKFALFDGLRMINGSYNWTRGAANINFENLIDTADAGLLKRFSAEFERLWKM